MPFKIGHLALNDRMYVHGKLCRMWKWLWSVSITWCSI